MIKENTIIFPDYNLQKKYATGTTLSEILTDLQPNLKYRPIGAMVNNKLEELSYAIYKPKVVRFIDLTHRDGHRMYVRSLVFVLQKAIADLYPQAKLQVEHSISKGYYCEIDQLEKPLDLQTVSDINNRMRQIIEADYPFLREEILTTAALNIFREKKYMEKYNLFKSRDRIFTSIYTLDNQKDYFYGYLAPSTGYLRVFDLVKYYNGMLLRVPKLNNPEQLDDILQQDKLFDILQEHKKWVDILEITSIADINQYIAKGKASELIKISEALHEKKVSQIADQIAHQQTVPRIILIAGPSSSGKTTFAKRLAIQLRVSGFKPIQLSLDNYFVDREKTPLDEKGEYDFEALEALDIATFNNNLIDLMDGHQVELPKFSFETGKRYYDGTKLQISAEHLILIEGIHGLNPKLTEAIADKMKFKVYISALTQIGIDGHNRIPTTDNRLIRRIVRDHRYRNYSALDTLRRWDSVRRGEERNIFPFQENSDVMFNSALLYELAVLKKHAEPLLQQIRQNVPEYAEAMRLLKFFSYFDSITPEKEIPPTSILREFLEGSSFKYD